MCQLGYTVNAQGLCEAISIENCLVLDQNGNCKVCNDRILTFGVECDINEKCSIKNCDLCTNIGGFEQCYLCGESFTVYPYYDEDNLITSKCFFQNAKSLNCRLTAFENASRCLECLPGYYSDDGGCFRADQDIKFEYEFYPLKLVSLLISILLM